MKIDSYWYDNEDSYVDYKVEEVIFPVHLEDMNGEVTVWNLNDK